MIALAVGKKGSGKSALLRKLSSLALAQKSAIFFHDPQHQLPDHKGRVYHSAAEYVRDTHPTFLSIFRECDPEEVAALALAVGNVTCCFDELDQAFAQKAFVNGVKSNLRRIIHEGRHYRVSLIGGFRRTANVSEDLMSQTDYMFLFRINPSAPGDTRAILERFGEAYAETAQRLQFGQFIVWTDDPQQLEDAS